MTRDKAILVLDGLSTWLGYERPITEEIVEAIKTISKPYLPSNINEAAEEWCKRNNKGIALCADKKSHYLVDGIDAFKAGALRDLPRWVSDGLPEGTGAIDISGLCGFDFLRRKGRLLRISSIEKLPGFKED